MFKDFQSKPFVRRALEITEDTKIKIISNTEAVVEYESGDYTHAFPFRYYEEINKGDFVVYLADEDIYHCRRAVFLERNFVEGVNI